MLAFTICTAVLCGFLGLIWKRSSVFNLFLKVALLGLSGWGVVLALMLLGFVVRS